MIMKPTPHQYFWVVLLALLVACGKQTVALPTEMPIPTDVSPTPLPTSTFIPVTITPSPLPTQPIIPIITPDPIQVERWKEYEDALVQSILPTFSFESILCEWDILARSGQEVYVWAVCASSKVSDWRPAVIHLGADGSVHSVEIPKRGSSSDTNRMFPEEAQVKFSLYTGDSLFDGRLKEMLNHLNYRETHPEEPPLIVLLATPIPTPTP
jgi:hypothetical protein